MITIKKVAVVVRKVCEQYAMSDESNTFDFHKVESLSCMCAIASYTLHNVLKQTGFKNIRLYEGQFNLDRLNHSAGHCWIEDHNETIIDITATQFKISDEVYIVTKNSAAFEQYTHRTEIKKLKDLYSWPESQQPHKKVITLLTKRSLKQFGGCN